MNYDNIRKTENRLDITRSKLSKQAPISQTERLRLKISDPTPFPLMMSHITYECVGRTNSKLMQTIDISRSFTIHMEVVVELVEFISFLLV